MKYIIDVPDEHTDIKVFYTDADMKIIQSMRCEPYIEPDRKAIEDEVWRDAWTMFLTPEDFGATLGDSYQEAKAKFEAWKKGKEEIRVGDEVKFLSLSKVGVIISEDDTPNVVGDKAFNVVWEDGATGYHYKKDLFRTGRHFDEVAELLKKMGEE